MQFYKITGDDLDSQPKYRVTRAEARDDVQTYSPGSWPDVRVELIFIRITQAVVAAILSGLNPDEEVLRTWAITPRGGFKEVQLGE